MQLAPRERRAGWCPSVETRSVSKKGRQSGSPQSQNQLTIERFLLGLRAYPLLMESKAALSFCFLVRLYRKTASHFSGRTLADPALPPALSGRRGPDRLRLWLGRRRLWDDSEFDGGLLLLLRRGCRFRLTRRPIRLCNGWVFRLPRSLLVGRSFGFRDGGSFRWSLFDLRLS